MKTKEQLDFGDIISYKRNRSDYDNQIGAICGKSLYFAWENNYFWFSSDDEEESYEYLGFDPNIRNLNNAVVGEFYYVLTKKHKLVDKYELLKIDESEDDMAFKMKCNTDKEISEEGENYFWVRIISTKQGFNYETNAMVNTNSFISNDDDDDNTSYLAPQPKAIL